MRGSATRESPKIEPFSGLDDNSRRRAPLAAARHLIAHPGGDFTVNLGVSAVGVRRDNRKAAVRCLANFDFERNFAEERNAQAFRLRLGAAVTEGVRALAAMRAKEITLVFDDPEHGHVDAPEHGDA